MGRGVTGGYCGAERPEFMESTQVSSCGVLTYLELSFLLNHIWSLSCQETM